jgi:hypothetical protein
MGPMGHPLPPAGSVPRLRPNANRRKEPGHATREGRFPLSPLPAVRAKPQPRSRTPVSCARLARTAHVKPMLPWTRNQLTPPATPIFSLTTTIPTIGITNPFTTPWPSRNPTPTPLDGRHVVQLPPSPSAIAMLGACLYKPSTNVLALLQLFHRRLGWPHL